MNAFNRYKKATIDAMWLAASAATRLEWALDLYAPKGFRKDGRRIRKGVISKAEFLKLINEPRP